MEQEAWRRGALCLGSRSWHLRCVTQRLGTCPVPPATLPPHPQPTGLIGVRTRAAPWPAPDSSHPTPSSSFSPGCLARNTRLALSTEGQTSGQRVCVAPLNYARARALEEVSWQGPWAQEAGLGPWLPGGQRQWQKEGGEAPGARQRSQAQARTPLSGSSVTPVTPVPCPIAPQAQIRPFSHILVCAHPHPRRRAASPPEAVAAAGPLPTGASEPGSRQGCGGAPGTPVPGPASRGPRRQAPRLGAASAPARRGPPRPGSQGTRQPPPAREGGGGAPCQ